MGRRSGDYRGLWDRDPLSSMGQPLLHSSSARGEGGGQQVALFGPYGGWRASRASQSDPPTPTNTRSSNDPTPLNYWPCRLWKKGNCPNLVKGMISLCSHGRWPSGPVPGAVPSCVPPACMGRARVSLLGAGRRPATPGHPSSGPCIAHIIQFEVKFIAG